ncbi:MAG: helix-turn-helix domain-containing protein [Caldilineaceae bacterium]
MEATTSFGQWVRYQRTALHLTQDELARQVYCSAIMIRKIESDERRPSNEIAERLAAQLRLPANLQANFVKVARGELNIHHLPYLHTPQTELPAWPTLSQSTRPPVPTTSFIGRARELAQICELVLNPETRLLTLIGPPGIGKTRLCLHVAGELQHAFLQGVTYVPLASVRDPALVIDTIAQLFGFADSSFNNPLDFLRVILRSKHLLLVLDNFEQVLPAARHLSELLEHAVHLTVLVTSRTPLNLTCERLWPVPPLSLTHTNRRLPVEVMIQQPAVQLFVTRARDVEPTFVLTADNVSAVSDICTRLDGLPLAIELAAARIRIFAPQALLARLSDRLDFLASSAVDRPTRHHTLHSAIGWSFDLLPTSAQRVYARLGVFLHGASLAAAQAVCNATGDLRHDVVELLTLLVDHSLVRREQDEDRTPRFTMLETTRDYALEQLTQRDELAVTRTAHAHYFLEFVETNKLKLHGLERRSWLMRFERDYDNLRAALVWAKESHDVATLTRLTAALGWFWELHGRRNEARTWLDTVMATPISKQPSSDKVRILHMLSHIAGEEGDLERSRSLASECLVLAETIGDQWTIALAQRELAWVYYSADNNFEQSLMLGDVAAAGLLAVGDLRNYILTLLDAAMSCYYADEISRGKSYAHKALRLAQAWEDAPAVCEAMSALGLLAHKDGDFARAQILLEECLTLSAQLPNGKQIAWQQYRMGQILLDSGNSTRAAEHFSESGRLWHERGETLAVAYCQSGQANCLFRQGAIARAQELYQATLEVYQHFAIDRAIAWSLWNLAHVAALNGEMPAVERLLDASLASFRTRHDTYGIAACESAMAGEWAAAREPIRV